MYKFFKHQGWCIWLGIMLPQLGIPFATLWTIKTAVMLLILIMLIGWHAGELEEIFSE